MEKKIETFPIGSVTYNSLRHFILDRKLKEDEVVQVNSHSFDDLVLEFREFYSSSMPKDVKILGVKIEESLDLSTGKIRVVSPIR